MLMTRDTLYNCMIEIFVCISRCIHYNYPEVVDFPSVEGESGYIYVDDKRYPIQLYDNEEVLDALGVDSMAILSPNQVGYMRILFKYI